jgi:hypothetical protein
MNPWRLSHVNRSLANAMWHSGQEYTLSGSRFHEEYNTKWRLQLKHLILFTKYKGQPKSSIEGEATLAEDLAFLRTLLVILSPFRAQGHRYYPYLTRVNLDSKAGKRNELSILRSWIGLGVLRANLAPQYSQLDSKLLLPVLRA